MSRHIVKLVQTIAEELKKTMPSLTEAVVKLPKFPDEVERITAFVYGHYDSRGGAMMITAPNEEAAHKAYVKTFFADEPEDFENQHAQLVDEDFMEGPIPVIVLGEKLPAPGNETDLLYSNPTFKDYWVKKNEKIVALLLSNKETKFAPTGFKLESAELGEDAFGLLYIKA